MLRSLIVLYGTFLLREDKTKLLLLFVLQVHKHSLMQNSFLRYADLVVDVDEAPVETTSSRIIHAIEEAVDAR